MAEPAHVQQRLRHQVVGATRLAEREGQAEERGDRLALLLQAAAVVVEADLDLLAQRQQARFELQPERLQHGLAAVGLGQLLQAGLDAGVAFGAVEERQHRRARGALLVAAEVAAEQGDDVAEFVAVDHAAGIAAQLEGTAVLGMGLQELAAALQGEFAAVGAGEQPDAVEQQFVARPRRDRQQLLDVAQRQPEAALVAETAEGAVAQLQQPLL